MYVVVDCNLNLLLYLIIPLLTIVIKKEAFFSKVSIHVSLRNCTDLKLVNFCALKTLSCEENITGVAQYILVIRIRQLFDNFLAVYSTDVLYSCPRSDIPPHIKTFFSPLPLFVLLSF